MAETEPVQGTQQPVILTTKTPYPLPTQKFMIPTTWKRYHLSQLVNKALSLTTTTPFDFLIRGEILKTSLGHWCSESGVGEVLFCFKSSFVGRFNISRKFRKKH